MIGLRFIIYMALISCVSYAAVNDANLLRNCSFEAGKSGWLFNSRPMGADLQIIAFDDAPEGGMAARVEVGKACNIASLASCWYELEEGHDYTFSVYLKSNYPKTAVTISVWSWADAQNKWNTKTESRETVFVNQTWQRFYVKANLEKARAGKYQVLIEMREPAVIFADAAMLTKTSEMTAFAADDIDFGIDFAEKSMLFSFGEELGFDCLVYNRSGKEQKLNINYSVSDFQDEAVEAGTESIAAPRGELSTRTLPLKLNKKGYYKITARLLNESGEVMGEQKASFAVIEKNKSKSFNANSPFGVSISPNNLELQLQRAKQIGVEHIRVHEIFRWKDTEEQKGVYKWANPDAAGKVYGDEPTHFNTQAAYNYSIFTENGFAPLIYVNTCKNDYPGWAADYSDDQKLSAYGDFYTALTSHYKGVFSNFEVINEPWGSMGVREYLDILKAVYQKSKQGNSDAVMIGVTGYHGPQIDFVKDIIDVGGLDYMDVFSLHPYPRPEPPEPAVIDFITQTQEWMKAKGKQLPIWITEMGWTVEGLEFLPTRIPRPSARNNTDTEQAQFLVRSNIISIANGVDVVYWFHYSGDNTWRYTYSMFECDPFSSPMKTIPAFSAMTNFLANADFVSKLTEGNGSQYAYLFSEGGRRIIAAWTVCSESTMFIETQAGSFDVYDIMGNKIKSIKTPGGISAVDIGDSPVYLVSSDAAFVNVQIKNHLSFELRKLPRSRPQEYTAVVKVSNPHQQKITADIEVLLPPGVVSSRQNAKIALEPYKEQTAAFPITVQSKADAVSEYITAVTNVEMGGKRYVLQSRGQLRYIKPLPKPAGGLWIEAEEPTEMNFENSPAWMPNQFRSYGGDNLRCRLFGNPAQHKEYIAQYDFTVAKSGIYSILIACTPFDKDDSLSRSIDGGEFITNKDSSRLGNPWVYSAHPNIWWRFKNVWNDMGQVQLAEGKHRLTLRFASPPMADYNYLTVDAIAILDERQKQQFIEALQD